MNRLRYSKALTLAALGLAAIISSNAQTNAPSTGPDPREIPIPEIKTDLGVLPGVNELPLRTDMPDPMIMNDGTRVTTREQWKARRAELRASSNTTPSARCLRRQET